MDSPYTDNMSFLSIRELGDKIAADAQICKSVGALQDYPTDEFNLNGCLPHCIDYDYDEHMSGLPVYKRFFSCIADILKNHLSCQVVQLADNNLGSGDSTKLCAALKQCSTLTALNLSGLQVMANDMEDAIEGLFAQDASCCICRLDLRFSEVWGLNFLAEALRDHNSLTYLNLSHNHIGFDSFAQQQLQFLDSLSATRSLRYLDLSLNDVDTGGAMKLARALRRNRSLTWLSLSGSSIEEAGLAAIASLLECRPEQRDLSPSSALTYLDLSNTTTENGGVDVFRRSIQNNTTLLYLDLSNSNCYNLYSDAESEDDDGDEDREKDGELAEEEKEEGKGSGDVNDSLLSIDQVLSRNRGLHLSSHRYWYMLAPLLAAKHSTHDHSLRQLLYSIRYSSILKDIHAFLLPDLNILDEGELGQQRIRQTYPHLALPEFQRAWGGIVYGSELLATLDRIIDKVVDSC